MNKVYVDMTDSGPIFYETYQGVPLPAAARQVSRKNFDLFKAGKGTFDEKGKFVPKGGR